MSFKMQSEFLLVVLSFAIIGVSLRLFARSNKHTQTRKAIPSPRTTLLPRLNSEQLSVLLYPPDLLPGPRDVDTPYGTMRVYEWGPEEGKKVIMISGDTTPAPIFSSVAKALVLYELRVIVIGKWTNYGCSMIYRVSSAI